MPARIAWLILKIKQSSVTHPAYKAANPSCFITFKKQSTIPRYFNWACLASSFCPCICSRVFVVSMGNVPEANSCELKSPTINSQLHLTKFRCTGGESTINERSPISISHSTCRRNWILNVPTDSGFSWRLGLVYENVSCACSINYHLSDGLFSMPHCRNRARG